MKRVGIVYLITEAPEARGVLDEPTETRRKTYCEEKSLSMSETYQARASGFAPTIRLVLPQEFEYRGETLCEYKGERYKIIRDYRDEKTGNSTELTLERIRGNAAAPVLRNGGQ
jgi:SPP1 family predicted phage head-tail adaptor